MPGAEDGLEFPSRSRPLFTILKQRVDLELDFARRSAKGSTELTIQPLARDIKNIQLHCRQCRPTLVQIGGINAKWDYDDPYRRARMPSSSTVHQHGMLKQKIEASLRPLQNPELVIAIPPKLKIQELQVDPLGNPALFEGTPNLVKQDTDGGENISTPIIQQQGPQFVPIKLTIEFEVDSFRDGIHWVGCTEDDHRYPYLYTTVSPMPGNTACIFPCLDDTTSRCTWELAIKAPRTLGDAFKRKKAINSTGAKARAGDADKSRDVAMKNNDPATADADEYLIDLSPEEAALELAVLCVGELTDDIADSDDDSRHIMIFGLNEVVAARHIAFAVGPFEHVDLTIFRATAEEEKLGQTAVKVEGYCLPGRVMEVENTCMPICQAIDHMGVNYGRFPFSSYQMLFVDDLVHDTTDAAGISICSARLLFPQEIIEPLDRNTRILARAVAHQWSGVNVIPAELTDTWVTSGIAGFMTDVFMKKLAGNNEYRWQQKLAAEKVYELDVDRPSVYHLGALVHIDASIQDFINLKSALILGILDRRLVKSSGSTGVMRIISKIFLNARSGTLNNAELSTQDFQRTCEKLGHNKLESFFKQWVMGAGCPIFSVSQRFNKKKTVVEMTITQMQLQRVTKPAFEPSNFMREIKEYVQEVWAPEAQAVFTGPMTIRIHEADGTPYEHIVEIREAVTKLEIQYNTKYKRLKRSRRQKKEAAAEGEGGDDALLYCLGDILDTPQDLKDWKLAEWSAEDEERMGQESYEWIRMDADFEWIGKIHLFMPSHMYISQLQQDRDLVAQYESMRFILGMTPHHVSLTLMVRTLMDSRYFHGIRIMAAEGIATLAKDKEGSYQLAEIGQYQLLKAFTDMFCDEGSIMPRPNDFSSRVTFIIQCAIPRAMAMFRDSDGRVPRALQQFFVDKLKFNDNSDNPFSDCHYVATLMRCLTDSLVVSHREVQPTYDFAFGDEDPMDTLEPENPDADFENMAIGEIERYRRIDEWVVTYQNLYTTTAIECLQKLTTAGIVKDKRKELLQYTRVSTAENVRLAAFRCLNEIGLAKSMPMLKHLIHSIVDHHSPYFRDRLLGLLGEALGHIALDDIDAQKAIAPAPVDGLVIEQDAANDNTQQQLLLEAARKATPEGAIVTLKTTLEGSEIFRQALWYAATAPDISIDEVAAYCDIAALIYEPITSTIARLPLPRPYRCVHQGKGKMRFWRHGTPRTTPSAKIGLPVEDYLELESLGLKYTGPLASATKKFLNERKNQLSQTESLKLQIAQAQQQLQSAKAQSAGLSTTAAFEMPPPLVSSHSVVNTPSTEKSGFKLSLGGKRKMSVDMTTSGPAQETPKVVKLGKLSTPKNPMGSHFRKSLTPATATTPAGGAAAAAAATSRSSSFSVNGSLASKVVKLRLRSSSARTSLQDILDTVPRRTIKPNGSSITYPAVSKSTISIGVTPSKAFSPPAASVNVGSFRSYGATPAPVEVKSERRQSDESLVSPTSAWLKDEKMRMSPPAMAASSAVVESAGSGAMQPPPPKKKFTLKLGKKTSMSPAE